MYVLIDTYRCLMQNNMYRTRCSSGLVLIDTYRCLMQNIGRLLESQEKVLIDTYRCLMQNFGLVSAQASSEYES